MPSRVKQHGVRRAAEMREVARMMREYGLDGSLAEAIADRHESFAGADTDLERNARWTLVSSVA
jgi:hypothetical protein